MGPMGKIKPCWSLKKKKSANKYKHHEKYPSLRTCKVQFIFYGINILNMILVKINNDSTCHLSSCYEMSFVALISSKGIISMSDHHSRRTFQNAQVQRVWIGFERFCFPSGGGVYTVQTRSSMFWFSTRKIHTSNTANKSAVRS